MTGRGPEAEPSARSATYVGGAGTWDFLPDLCGREKARDVALGPGALALVQCAPQRRGDWVESRVWEALRAGPRKEPAALRKRLQQHAKGGVNMKPPVFEGLPSPSLKKMQSMSSAELKDHLDKLEQERVRLAERLQRLKKSQNMPPRDPRFRLETRLAKLIERGRQILNSKQPRGYEAGPRRAP